MLRQGNEFSYYMLLTAAFVLNESERAGQWALHPWVHSACNQLSDADQMRAVRLPRSAVFLHAQRSVPVSVARTFRLCTHAFAHGFSRSSCVE